MSDPVHWWERSPRIAPPEANTVYARFGCFVSESSFNAAYSNDGQANEYIYSYGFRSKLVYLNFV